MLNINWKIAIHEITFPLSRNKSCCHEITLLSLSIYFFIILMLLFFDCIVMNGNCGKTKNEICLKMKKIELVITINYHYRILVAARFVFIQLNGFYRKQFRRGLIIIIYHCHFSNTTIYTMCSWVVRSVCILSFLPQSSDTMK